MSLFSSSHMSFALMVALINEDACVLGTTILLTTGQSCGGMVTEYLRSTSTVFFSVQLLVQGWFCKRWCVTR